MCGIYESYAPRAMLDRERPERAARAIDYFSRPWFLRNTEKHV